MPIFRWIALLLVLVTVFPVLAQDGKKNAAKNEKLFHAYSDGGLPVGDFRLQERHGQFVRSRDLLGKVWVAQFFYPGCNLCSRNTPTMKSLQDHYRGKADFRLVSIDLIDSLKTIGPETLHEFAKSYEADPDQWLLLTGSEDKVGEVLSFSFFSMHFPKKDPMVGDAIAHKTDLVLVNHRGTMVGYVDGTKPGAADALIVEIDRLRGQRRMEDRIPITGADLPWVNAMLNSSCTILLLLGWMLIRMRYEKLHKLVMLSALAVSMVFLTSYLFYHFVVMEMEPMRFRGEGTAKYVYFAILLSHTILAIMVAPLAIYITVQGLRNALAAHVKLARWTLPIWLYVSVTGVIVYWMLYRMEW